MKISYRTHPALEYLKDGKFELKISEYDLDSSEKVAPFTNLFYCHKIWYNKEIFLVSNAFFEATVRSLPKLSKIYNELQDKPESFHISGTYIIKNQVFCIDYNSWEWSKFDDLSLFVFRKNGELNIQYTKGKEDDQPKRYCWTSNIEKTFFSKFNTTEICCNAFLIVLFIWLFKKYAQVETKYLPPNKRVKDINCKYVNDTSLGITHLDSRWFTNLVKSDAFKVRGHFRLQPKKKDGEWTKELIWITDFEKKGYTSKARKLSLEGTSQPTTDNR